jgi:hypothetical protein
MGPAWAAPAGLGGLDLAGLAQCGEAFEVLTMVPALKPEALTRREPLRVNANVVNAGFAFDLLGAEFLEPISRAKVAGQLRRVIPEVFVLLPVVMVRCRARVPLTGLLTLQVRMTWRATFRVLRVFVAVAVFMAGFPFE